MFPVVLYDIVQPAYNVVIVYLDGQFTATVEAAGSEIDGSDDRAQAVSEQHLAVKLEVLHLADFDSNIIHHTQAADALYQLFLFKRVRRARHNMHFHSAHLSADQVLDDDGVLVPFILQE